LPKIRQVRRMITELGLDIEVEVDGGISVKTAPLVVEAGANVLVAGSAVFDHPAGATEALRELLESAKPASGRTRV